MTKLRLRSLLLLFVLLCSFKQGYSQNCAVFSNEFHYENTGADVGERVEIAGEVGTDLTDRSLVFYNGADGTTYATAPLNGTHVVEFISYEGTISYQ
jgi:hypothetical protein